MIKILRQLRYYKIQIAIVIVLTFVQVFSQLLLPTLMADIVDIGVVTKDTRYIMNVGLVMLAVALVGTGAAVVSSYSAVKVGVGYGRDLRKNLFEKVQSFSSGEFDKVGTSSLITRTTNDIKQMQNLVITGLRMMVRAPLMAIGGIVMAVSRNQELSLVIIGSIVSLGVVIGVVIFVSMPLFRAMQDKLDDLNRIIRERLTGVRVIRAFNRMEHEREKFDFSNSDLAGTSLKVYRIMGLMMPLMILLINITIVAIVWLGAFKIDSGEIQVGDIMALIQYAVHILNSVIMLTMIFISVPRAMVSSDRINEVLDMKTRIKDPVTAKKPYPGGALEFRNVCFWYEGAKEPALEDISFTLNQGESMGIIGSTGTGKSTLVNLIPRFYDPCKGSILMGGVDIREMSQSDIRSRIGMVPQRAVLFSGSVEDNISFGDERISSEGIEKAARTSQAEEFIVKMDKGYESKVFQGGANFSGGQRQRLSIARALASKREIYIFDDSFSALDFKTDAALRRALREETSGSSAIIVSQRVSTIMDLDKIIVLENGKMAGLGRHSDLMEKSSVYRDIVLSQMAQGE
ncbi:ATP-binding cassette, subfamily B [Peptoclostridium litorale DSM 5388]|uniref:Putative ABC transporter ATP-binding protein n=1 Tax=Peptoclostridium litorale DSM 5388 TaxID=1121324 RepID=A0A069RBT8_PEPLI|nr:ABC transporter ATP-binding protein [Peptoclostridium litorale]KDR94534.1 putative ABC transporter ATP-binding protein [Peptoclostridium litorale DSM 5388]SIO37180.1 ATP-binding cassette, subfamily B [Peptoclostridium litorale DSM 5388]